MTIRVCHELVQTQGLAGNKEARTNNHMDDPEFDAAIEKNLDPEDAVWMECYKVSLVLHYASGFNTSMYIVIDMRKLCSE